MVAERYRLRPEGTNTPIDVWRRHGQRVAKHSGSTTSKASESREFAADRTRGLQGGRRVGSRGPTLPARARARRRSEYRNQSSRRRTMRPVAESMPRHLAPVEFF